MPKVAPIQNAFSGEYSPLMYGRTDYDKYRRGLAVCLNAFSFVQGPWVRRPPTRWIAEVKDSARETRVRRFEFSTTQAYILEFGHNYVRVYKDQGQVETSPGVAYEVTTTYTESQVFDLVFEQSADVLYITHPSHPPRKLSRTGHTAWTLTEHSFIDGPYAPTNSTATTFTPAATTGAGVVITASSTAGINGGAGFRSADVGRWVRIKQGSAWGWGQIVTFADTTHVAVDILGAFSTTGASVDWRMSLYNSADGYPACVTFHEDRLLFGGSAAAPHRLDGSRTGLYGTFSPSDADGTIADDHAIQYTLNSKNVQAIRWMSSDEKALLVGTASASWVVRASSLGEALSPTNVSAKPGPRYGSAAIAPVDGSKSVLFVTRNGRKLRELAYNIDVDGYRAPDLTVIAEHVTKGGLKELALQEEPQSMVWAVRNDGVLLSLSYERDQDLIAWHRHTLGGWSNAGHTTHAVVESVAVIPSSVDDYDEVWMVVRRYIDGGTKRYVEMMLKPREYGDAQEDAVFVDCSLTYDGASATTITGLDHLEGETVQVLVDGATHPDCEVSSGSITLDRAGSVVHVGYSYNSDGQMLRIDAGAADGTSQGKIQRAHKCTFRLLESLGMKVGPSFSNLTPVTFRTSGNPTGQAVPLFTGDKEVTWEGDYSTANHICWRFDQPLPGTVQAVMPRMHTQDG